MQVLWAMSKPCLAPMDKGVGREGEGEGARWETGGGIRRVWDQKSVVTTSCLLHQENRFSRATAEQSAGKYRVLREFIGPVF